MEIETPPETGTKTGTKTPEKQSEKDVSRLVKRPLEEMERFFEEFPSRSWLQRREWEWPSWPESLALIRQKFPALDVIDHKEEIVLRAGVPGVTKDDLDVSISEGTITIKGSTKREVSEKKENYYRHEMSTGEFSRTVTLPTALDADKAKAKLDHGILEIRIPKREGAKTRPLSIEES